MSDNNPLKHNELDWLFDEEDFVPEMLDPFSVSNTIPMFFDYCEEKPVNREPSLNYDE